jgi:LytS/YehU family sensor histidine kinase
VLSSVVWTLGLLAFEPLVGREPWAPPNVTAKEQLFFGTIRGFFFFILWSGAFLVNLLSSRVQRAVEHSARAQALADEAQLQLLRSQINPHFLFNALNSVIGLIGENPRGAQSMVRDVASLLRKALDADARKETSVEQELELVRLYVRCEQVRFEARLEVAFEIADEAKGLAMPPMLLQPLVENAIKHGMQAAVDAPLKVRVSARREGEALVLEVANSGSLLRRESAILPEPSGIGLRNVQGRLSQLYPGAPRFALTEREGWVLARIELPLRPAQEGR